MAQEPQMADVTSEDWDQLSNKIESFAATLDTDEQIMLKAIVALAGAELAKDQDEDEDEDEDVQGFAVRLRPGVNLRGRRNLSSSFNKSFGKLAPNALQSPTSHLPNSSGLAAQTVCIQ